MYEKEGSFYKSNLCSNAISGISGPVTFPVSNTHLYPMALIRSIYEIELNICSMNATFKPDSSGCQGKKPCPLRLSVGIQ